MSFLKYGLELGNWTDSCKIMKLSTILYHPQKLTQNGLKILRPETVKFQEDDQGVNSLTSILAMISFFFF